MNLNKSAKISARLCEEIQSVIISLKPSEEAIAAAMYALATALMEIALAEADNDKSAALENVSSLVNSIIKTR